MISRRGIIGTLAGLIAAPAIIRVADLMPIKPVRVLTLDDYAARILGPQLDVMYGKTELRPDWLTDDHLADAMVRSVEDTLRSDFDAATARNSILSPSDIRREAVRLFNEQNLFLDPPLRIRLPNDYAQGNHVRRAWIDTPPSAISPVQAAALGAAALVASNPVVSRRFWEGSK